MKTIEAETVEIFHQKLIHMVVCQYIYILTSEGETIRIRVKKNTRTELTDDRYPKPSWLTDEEFRRLDE